MGVPQIIMIVLLSIGLLLSAKDHGRPRTGSNSFWSNLISVGVAMGLLLWGGFFK